MSVLMQSLTYISPLHVGTMFKQTACGIAHSPTTRLCCNLDQKRHQRHDSLDDLAAACCSDRSGRCTDGYRGFPLPDSREVDGSQWIIPDDGKICPAIRPSFSRCQQQKDGIVDTD